MGRRRLVGASIAVALVLAATVSCGGGSGSGGGGDTSGGGGGSGSGGGGDTSGGGGGSGSGGGSGGASDPCAGLTASPDAGRVFRYLDPNANRTCWAATSSTAGQIALGVLEAGRAAGTVTFRLSAADGATPQGSIPVARGVSDVDPWFHETAAGWAGIVHDTSTSPYGTGLGFFDPAGTPLGRTTGRLVSTSAPDGNGGTVALSESLAPGGTLAAPTLEWLDARGATVRTATLDESPTSGGSLLLVSWSTGHVLVLLAHPSGLRGRWYDGTGAPLTPWFDAVALADEPTMHLLLDGTIALGDAKGWRGLFRDAVAAMDPPPGWLAARPGRRLASIRGGRGYAALPFPDGSGRTADQTTVELLAPGGQSCGTVALPPAPAEAGVTRDPRALFVGQDGTIFEIDGLSGGAFAVPAHCDFRWWPALLR